MKDFKKCYNSKTMVKNERTWLYEVRNQYKKMKLNDFITSNEFVDDVTDKSFDDMMSDNVELLLSQRKSILNDVILKRNILDLEGTTWDSVKYEFDWLIIPMQNAYGSLANQATYQYTTWYTSDADTLRMITSDVAVNTLKAEYAVTNNLLEDTFYNVWEKVQRTIVESYLRSFDNAYYLGLYKSLNQADPDVSSTYDPLNAVSQLWTTIDVKSLINMIKELWADTWSEREELTFHMNNNLYLELLKDEGVRNSAFFWRDEVNASGQLKSVLWVRIYVSELANASLLPEWFTSVEEPVIFLTNDRYSVVGFKRNLTVEDEYSARKWATYVVGTTRYWLTILENYKMWKESIDVNWADWNMNFVVVAWIYQAANSVSDWD